LAIIEAIVAREILDSRGNPTVEVEVGLDDGTTARAAVPSGASTGAFEAIELRDADAGRYGGKGVGQAVANVTGRLAPELYGHEASDQRLVDAAMLDIDGTPDKSAIGANAILGVSLAVAKAAAESADLPLFRPRRAERAPAAGTDAQHPERRAHADSNVTFRSSGARSARPRSGRRCGPAPRCHALKAVLKRNGLATGLGDEGGFAPNLPANAAALDFIAEAIRQAGYRLGADVVLALDVAATEFYRDGAYQFEGSATSADELTAYYGKLVDAAKPA
jgi:enolase